MQLPYLPCYVLTFSTLVVLYVTYKSSTLLMGGRENLLTTAWESKIIGFLLLIALNTLRVVKIPCCQGLVTFQSSKRDFIWLADRWDFLDCYCQSLGAVVSNTCLRLSRDDAWWTLPYWPLCLTVLRLVVITKLHSLSFKWVHFILLAVSGEIIFVSLLWCVVDSKPFPTLVNRSS